MEKRKNKKNHPSQSTGKNRQAFSMVEVLVASFLLVVGILAVVSLMAKNMKQLIDSRNQVAASLLSEEGLELVRNLRDQNLEGGEETFKGLADGENCKIDINSPSLECGKSDFKLYQSGNFFVHIDSGNPTNFARKLTVEPLSPGQKKVTSFVFWNESKVTEVTDENACNLQNSCAYTQTILTSWGSN